MAACTLVPLSSRALANDEVRYDLTAVPLRFTPAPGVSVDAVAYNGMIPGPVLRVRRGQRLRVRYVNRS
jgi:FtsP/CotA-like multicopper oxidase with cupredoxin domain